MKVYVCWTVPDYIGIDIEAIFLHEEDAIGFVDRWNCEHKEYNQCSYDEFEVQ